MKTSKAADTESTDDSVKGPRSERPRPARTPSRELWDGPASKAVAMYEFAKAKLTGEKPNLGENRKTTVEM